MKKHFLILALLAAGIAHAGNGGPNMGANMTPATGTAITVTAVSLPANVLAARAVVSADLAAVAAARTKLVADVAANNSSAIATDVAAYKAARLQLETDMDALRTAALSILEQDENTLLADRILLDIDRLTNDTAAFTAQLTQFRTDQAQAEANRQAIFGDLCPTGIICHEGPGGSGPGDDNRRPKR